MSHPRADDADTRTYLRTWTVLLRINTGPPTWWRPNASIQTTRGITHLRLGWLRTAIQIGYGTRRHHEEETAP